MFLTPADIAHIYLKTEFVDLRKGILGLSALVSREFGATDGTRSLFVFTNRSRNRLRILYWDDTGFAFWHKALEQARFKWPKSDAEDLELSTQELRWLLSGVDISRIKMHQRSNPKSPY
ncbi:IS66 family insertion sequence element accessory protein TnpB [soil metagenome]